MKNAALRLPVFGSGGGHTSSALLSLALIPMAIIFILVVVMFWISLQKGAFGTPSAVYTLRNYHEVFSDPFVYRVAWNTIQFTVTATFVALLIGLPIAWLTERTSLPGKTLVYAIMTLGLLIPGIYTAMGWTMMAHPRIGIINRWLMQLLNLDDAPINIATPVGMGFVQGLSLSALAFILTSQMFRAMNPSLEEAARVHGMGYGKILWRVTLPLARPGILAAVIYILTIGIATFDIPAILGLGNRVYMLSTFIYLKVHPQGAGGDGERRAGTSLRRPLPHPRHVAAQEGGAPQEPVPGGTRLAVRFGFQCDAYSHYGDHALALLPRQPPHTETGRAG